MRSLIRSRSSSNLFLNSVSTDMAAGYVVVFVHNFAVVLAKKKDIDKNIWPSKVKSRVDESV
jgi:hypothetical protein